MEVIVGREAKSRRLSVKRDGKLQMCGEPGSVPMDVSKQHASLLSKGNGRWELRNLNPQNVTFVNGLSVEQKIVSETDRVELGASHYLLSWDAVCGSKQETADIRHLRSVWGEYRDRLNEIEERQKNNSLLQSLPILIGMLGGLAGHTMTQNASSGVQILASSVAPVLGIIIMLISLYRRKTDNSRGDKEALTKWMYKQYVCPKCGKFLGMHDYDLIVQQHDNCNFCKAKFIK